MCMAESLLATRAAFPLTLTPLGDMFNDCPLVDNAKATFQVALPGIDMLERLKRFGERNENEDGVTVLWTIFIHD